MKKEHGENVNDCWDILAGKCDLGDGLCWFKHDANINTSKIQCKICGNNFENLNNFMIHKKDEHTATVQQLFSNVQIRNVSMGIRKAG